MGGKTAERSETKAATARCCGKQVNSRIKSIVLHPLSYGQINHRANTFKVFVHVQVGKTKNFQAILHQNGGAFLIICQTLLFIMLGAIQFNHQLCSMAVKVGDETVDGNLTPKMNWICRQKIIPQMIFLFGGVLPQFLCTRYKLGLIRKR